MDELWLKLGDYLLFASLSAFWTIPLMDLGGALAFRLEKSHTHAGGAFSLPNPESNLNQYTRCSGQLAVDGSPRICAVIGTETNWPHRFISSSPTTRVTINIHDMSKHGLHNSVFSCESPVYGVPVLFTGNFVVMSHSASKLVFAVNISSNPVTWVKIADLELIDCVTNDDDPEEIIVRGRSQIQDKPAEFLAIIFNLKTASIVQKVPLPLLSLVGGHSLADGTGSMHVTAMNKYLLAFSYANSVLVMRRDDTSVIGWYNIARPDSIRYGVNVPPIKLLGHTKLLVASNYCIQIVYLRDTVDQVESGLRLSVVPAIMESPISAYPIESRSLSSFLSQQLESSLEGISARVLYFGDKLRALAFLRADSDAPTNARAFDLFSKCSRALDEAFIGDSSVKGWSWHQGPSFPFAPPASHRYGLSMPPKPILTDIFLAQKTLEIDARPPYLRPTILRRCCGFISTIQ
jgi:hypothetical protein